MQAVMNTIAKIFLYLIDIVAMLLLSLLFFSVIANDPLHIIANITSYMGNLSGYGFTGFLAVGFVLVLYSLLRYRTK